MEPQEQNFNFKVLEVVDEPGSSGARVVLEIEDGFKEWFVEHHGLKRWSQKHFQAWFVKALEEYLRTCALTEEPKESRVNEELDILRR